MVSVEAKCINFAPKQPLDFLVDCNVVCIVHPVRF